MDAVTRVAWKHSPPVSHTRYHHAEAPTESIRDYSPYQSLTSKKTSDDDTAC